MVTIYGKIGPFQNLKEKLALYNMEIKKIEDYPQLFKDIQEKENTISQDSEIEFQTQILSLTQEVKDIDTFIHAQEEALLSSKLLKRYYIYVQLYHLKKEKMRIEDKLFLFSKEKLEFIDKYSQINLNSLKEKKYILKTQQNNYFGALAEIEVQNHLKNLYLHSKLINNFYQIFDKAIAMKGGNDWIQSIQIDHILINQKGIFLIETKNWSKNSEKNIEFSPVYQAKRHGHAFYFHYRYIFEKQLGFVPRIYNIVAKKQSTELKYNEMYHIYEMLIFQLNNFIQGRADSINLIQVEKILKILQ